MLLYFTQEFGGNVLNIIHIKFIFCILLNRLRICTEASALYGVDVDKAYILVLLQSLGNEEQIGMILHSLNLIEDDGLVTKRCDRRMFYEVRLTI